MVHTTCAAAGCKSSRYTNKEVRFHQFPRTEERCKIWVEACKRPDLADRTCESLKNTYMCSLHFEKLMYGKKSLKKTAVPTLLLPSLDWIVKSEKPEVKLLNDSELDISSELAQKQYETGISSLQIASLNWIVKSEKPEVEHLNNSELKVSSELAQKQHESGISSSQIASLDWIVKSEKQEVELLNDSELEVSSELAQKQHESGISSSQIAGDNDTKKYIRINRSTQTETRLAVHIPRKPKIKIQLSKTSNRLKCYKNFENIAKKQFLKDCDKYLSPKLSAIVKAQMYRKYRIGK